MTDTKVVPLEPCPFCGGDNLLERAVPNTQGNRHYIACYNSKCLAEGPWSWAPRTASEQWNRRAAPAHPSQQQEGLAADILVMLDKRGWSKHWTHRGVYIHLEASELIEAIRGKHGDPLKEAADVLLVLMSITEYAGIPWDRVMGKAREICDDLMVRPRYSGEEYSEAAAALTPPAPQEGEPSCMAMYRGSKSDNDICNVVRYADSLRAQLEEARRALREATNKALEDGDWQCRDYADGWITFPDRTAAERYQQQTGAMMRYRQFFPPLKTPPVEG